MEQIRTVRDHLRLVTVEPYLFFIVFGYVGRIVTFQALLMDSACRNMHFFSDEVCSALDNHEAQKAVSIEAGLNLYAYVMLLSSLPAIVVAVFLGPWSDKYSRKYPLAISAAGLLLDAAVTAVLSFNPGVSPAWYVASALFAGFSGSYITSMSSSFSYMADVTDERSRPSRYAVLEASSILSTLLGTCICGWIFKIGGYQPVMITAAVSFAAALVYAVFCVRETKRRPDDQALSQVLRELITVQNIKDSYRTCSTQRPGNIRLQIWLLVWASFSQKFVDMGTVAVSYPFAQVMYSWSVTEFSNACTAFYVFNGLMTVVVVPLLSNKLRIHEAGLGLVGTLSLVAKMVIMSVANHEPLFYYGWFSGALNNATNIAIRAKLSKLVNKDELGRAFSLLATCESLTPLLGTLIFVQIFSASQLSFPGMPYALASIFLIPSAIIFSWMLTLPTIALGEFDRDRKTTNVELEETFSPSYITLREEKI